jgi:hypothetical protein
MAALFFNNAATVDADLQDSFLNALDKHPGENLN